MKKIFVFLFALTFTMPAFCEAIKLKNGLIINGSIIDRSEYILKVQTSYGIISLNQREIEKIMPDLHRVFLKGGGEYVGTVVDLDDFNLTLNTDNGLVNIDVAQITSMEIYDYEEAAKQKKYVENKIEQETQEKAQEEDKKQKAATTTMGTSGLSFDEDLEKVFPSKPQETEEVKYIYKTHEDTPEQIKAAAEDKAALEALTPAEKEQKIKEEALSFDQNKKRKDGKNYFALHLGLLKTKLQVDISEFGGPDDFAVSGQEIAFGLNYMRKLTNRFWYGGGLAFGMLPKKSMQYDRATNKQGDTQITGQVYDLNALFNFYLNPQNPVRVYLTGGANITSVGIDKSYAERTDSGSGWGDWTVIQTKDSTQTVIGTNVGLGLEWTIEDINIGLETRLRYTPLKKELSNSSKTSVLVTLKTSWFF